MLRITTLSENEIHVTLRVEGQIALPWLLELEREIRRHLASGRDVELDFSGVTYIGAYAAEVVRDLLACGVVLSSCPPLIRGTITNAEPA